MADQVEQIRQKIDIVSFISEYLPLKKAGRNFKALCPFHSEKTSSFVVSPERQIWHCFGGCQTGGDIFGFLMRLENVEFGEALKILAQRAGIKLLDFRPSPAQKLKEKIYEINHLVSEFYHYLLLNHSSGKTAQDYLLSRGMSQKSMRLFKLGWAPRVGEGLSKFLLKKGYESWEIDQAGVAIKGQAGEWRDRFFNRIIFTLKDARGNVVGFSGRVLPESEMAKYINTPETLAYHKGDLLYGLEITREAVKKAESAIIVEGELDAILSYQAGVDNVVATKGTALTESQIRLLKRFTENASLALDMDLAGNLAARRAVEMADLAGLNLKVIQLRQGKDPAEAIKKDPKLWFAAVKKAQPVWDWLILKAWEKYQGEGVFGKKKLGEEVLPFLGRIQNEIVKTHYLRKLAKILEVSEAAVREELVKITKSEKEVAVPVKVRQTRQELLEQYFLGLLLQSEGPQGAWEHLKTAFPNWELEEEDFTLLARQKIFLHLKLALAQEAAFQIEKLTRHLPQEILAVFDRLYLQDLGEMAEEKKLAELKKAALEIKKLTLKRKLEEIFQKLKSQGEKELPNLNQEFNRLSLLLKSLT